MNHFDIGLAFLEGLALIVSPCILPVLPLVLAASADGGRRRPYGVICGFVLAFSLFALAARKAVALLGLDLDLVKDASLWLLGLFGLVMLSSQLSDKFGTLTRGLADLGNRLAGNGSGGFGGGLVVGALIGLVWTPCAGPILAAVLVQVIRQQSDLSGSLVIVAFGIGAGLPMLLISLFGRALMNRFAFFTRHAQAVRRTFGALILASVAFIASGVDAQSIFSPATSKAARPGATGLQHGLPQPYPAPRFTGIATWLNSPPLTMGALKGKVVLVDFWTYSCINCVRTLPHITEWDKKYRDRGLVIVGVHAPEFEFEKKLDNVRAAVAQYGIRYPVALDNRLDTWSNFDNLYWPAHYLIDREGQVVYTHYGEGEYDVTENNIRYLLGLDASVQADTEQPSYLADQTPETYLGYRRAEHFGGKREMARDAASAYRFPAFLSEHEWGLDGKWRSEPEKIVSLEKDAALRINFKARKVFLVLGSADGKPKRLSVRLNGEPVGANAGQDAANGTLTVERNTLYELIDQKTPKNSLLEIHADDPGVEAYAFTFGS